MNKYKYNYLFLILPLLLVIYSCTTGKSMFEYEASPSKEYHFGNNGELSVILPIPTVGEGGYLYSNYLRYIWVGSGFIDYSPISEIEVTNEIGYDGKYNVINLYFNNSPSYNFSLFRFFSVNIDNNPVVITIITSNDYSLCTDEQVKKWITEDNALFIKIINTIRIKGKENKSYKINVDYEDIIEKAQRISSNKSKSGVTSEIIHYELIEDTSHVQ